MNRERDRCIALAGLFQAADLAAEIAHKAMVESAPLEASVYSLFQIDAESTESVFGEITGVNRGLSTLIQQLDGGKRRRNLEVTRYVVQLLHLERKLSKDRKMLVILSQGLDQATANLEHFGMTHSNTLARLADLYSTTISTMKPRILVQGSPMHLQNPDNVNKIRTLLLAGIRAARLWRQCGGNRLQLFLGRRTLLEAARSLQQRG